MHYANVLDVVFVLAGLQVTKFFLSSILVVFDDAGSSCHVRFAKMWTVTDGDCANARAGGNLMIAQFVQNGKTCVKYDTAYYTNTL